MSTEETEDVWTFDYDPDRGLAHPLLTTCAKGKFGYPNQTVDGMTMYENTHFRTEAEAWKCLRDNADAHEKMWASDYRQAQTRLRICTDKLAQVAAFAVEVRENHRKFTERK